MGNEQTSNNVTLPRPGTAIQRAQKLLTAPNTAQNSTSDDHENNGSAGSIHEITEMLTEIASEIDDQYTNFSAFKSSKCSMGQSTDRVVDSDNPVDSLSFVPKQNVVESISTIFSFRKQLGLGASCRVLLVEERSTKQKYALKQLPKSELMNRSYFYTEYRILSLLSDHKNIISFHSSFIDDSSYYLATRYCSGGTMLDRIIDQGHFSESQCAEFIKNVLFGLHHMHSHHVVHRDIKVHLTASDHVE